MESPTDSEGGTQTVILSLDTKSVKPYATQDEYLYAMKEDLAEWFNTLYGLHITVDDFFEQLETGVIMCQHANNVTSFIKEQLGAAPLSHSAPKRPPVNLPDRGVQYRSSVKAGSFQSRDNVSNFIAWCKALGINNVILFETEDLVLRKNERHVVLCLLEVARRGAQYGMLAPTLVQMEREIDAEIAGHEPPVQPAGPVPQRKTCDLMSLDEMKKTSKPTTLDEMVREMVSLCTCPDQFPMVKVSEGKYKIGDSQTLIFVRILRNHVMVRIGGGWDTLENYLDRHDPCRCAARGHKGRVAGITPTKSAVRRQSAPANQLVGVDQRVRTSNTPSADSGKNQKAERAQTPSKQVGGAASRSKRSLSLAPQPSPSGDPQQWKQPAPQRSSTGSVVSRSLDPSAMPGMRSPSPASSTSSEASRRQGVVSMSRDSGIGSGRREMDSASDASSSCGGSPGLTKRFSSTSDLTFPKELTLSGNEDVLPRMRPTSARDRARRATASSIPTGPKARGGATSSNNNNNNESSSGRGRQKQKSPVAVTPGRQTRSRSVEPMDLNIERFGRKTPTLNKMAGLGQKKQENEVLIISRDSRGRHQLGPQILSPGNGDSDLDGYPSGSSRHSSTSSSMSGPTNGYSNGYTSSGEDKRPGTPRVKLSPDRILPDKPKLMSRSHTADLGHMGETHSVTAGEDSTDTDTESRTHTVTRMSMSSNQSSTLSLASSFDDYPEAPPEDKNLNAEMERLFEEFRRQEMTTKKPSSRSRHRRSNSADLLEMDGAMYDRQKVNNAFQKARSSSRDMLDGPSSGSRVRSRRSSTASVESNSSSTRQTASSTPARRTGTITPTPTRTSSLRGALGMARELRNKLNESSGTRQTPVRSSSMNTPRSTTPLVASRTATSQAGGATRGRSQTRDDYRSGSTTGSRASSRAGSRNPSRDSSLTRERLRPSSAMSHREQQQKTGPRRPTSARTTQSRSREDLLDGGGSGHKGSRSNGSGPVMNGRSRSQSITNMYPDCASPESSVLSPDDQLICHTDLSLQVDGDREAHTPKPRKDKQGGRTRIPMPVDMLQNPKYDTSDQPLRRYDSGVDINNMSPTESSVHGDDNWQQEFILQPEQNALQLATQSLGYHVTSGRANGQSGYDDMF